MAPPLKVFVRVVVTERRSNEISALFDMVFSPFLLKVKGDFTLFLESTVRFFLSTTVIYHVSVETLKEDDYNSVTNLFR